MAEKREVELLRQAKQGDRHAQEAIVRRYRPLIEARARTFARPGVDRDDLVQEGVLSVLRAIRRFDENRANGFAAFAEVCVRRRLISLSDRAKRHVELPSLAASPAAQSHAIEFPFEIDGIPLTVLERQVIAAFRLGLSYAEISDQLSCGVKRVDNALQRIRRKCQRVNAQN
ncbi:MAG: sigma-70 family RNA polymerase sigma factor [Methanoregulaceae archaeon]|nr:sigma-70 family RNA polymerase sigma factor [Methanoregulaceae archaeon]